MRPSAFSVASTCCFTAKFAISTLLLKTALVLGLLLLLLSHVLIATRSWVNPSYRAGGGSG
jgi:hypothetical protein